MFLDTSFCIDLMRERSRKHRGAATAKLHALGNTPLYASVFVMCELHAGARMSAHPDKELRKIALLAERLHMVYPGPAFAVAYGETEAHIRKNGSPVPTMDLLIGVIAKSYGMPILTRDASHFSRIPELVIETY